MKDNILQHQFNRTGARVKSPSSGVRPGARALNLELPTSFGWLRHFGASTPSALVSSRSSHFSKSLTFAKPALAILAVAFLTLFGLGNSAYAASYLNVSSSGSVSFGSIRPTSSGTSSTATDKLTIHTDCPVGYSVYVSGQNGKDTNLTNSSASSNNTISTSDNAIGSAGSLSVNTWGLNHENDGTYVGLPTYADATSKALTTKSDVEETSTVDIYYGLKVNTALTPGTYTGDVLYTVIMASSCQAYTVIFDANGGTSTMTNQSIMASATTNLSANAFTRTNYTFLGWSKSANGKTGTATDGVGTADDVEYTDKESVTDLTTGGGSITLYAIWEENSHWTINYSSNGADSGSPSKTTEGTVYSGSVTMPTAGTMVKSGYELKGWAFTSGATAATYQAEETVALSALLTAASSAGQSTASGSTITLYPVWGVPDDGNLGTMQDFVCNNLTSGHTATLTDSRDGQTYSVYRIPTDQTYAGTSTVANVAGKCIMTKDLNLGAVASVSGASSSITANGTMTLSPNDSGFTTPTGSGEPITVPTSSVTVSNTYSSTNSYSNKYYVANGTGNYAGRGYYSWGAAMVACPKGWRLPTSGEYVDRDSWERSTAGISAIVRGSSAAATISNMTSSPYSFVLGGDYDGSFGSAGASGYYWSSTQYDSRASYLLYMRLSSSLQRSSFSKYYGFAVRCIADERLDDDGNVGNMQTPNICSGVTAGHTATLTDTRDNQEYGVYRWPNTGTAGTDYPTDMAGYCIMTKDLSLGYVTGGSITASSNLSLTADSSNYDTNASNSSFESFTLSGTQTVTYVDSVNNGTGWSTTNSYTNKQYTNGPKSGSEAYTSHSYYSWGAAIVACPKGWRLPTETEYNNVVTSLGGGNSGMDKIIGIPYNFILGGHFRSTGWTAVDDSAGYWSSTQKYGKTTGINLNIGLSWMYPAGNDKNNGRAVRCIATP